MKYLSIFLLAIAILFGCATPPTSGTGATTASVVAYASSAEAERAVFTAKTGYATALTAAVAYKNLPVCSINVNMPCSDAAIVAQVQKADNVAAAALDAAESIVRTPSAGPTARDQAIATANSALAALSTLLTNAK